MTQRKFLYWAAPLSGVICLYAMLRLAIGFVAWRWFDADREHWLWCLRTFGVLFCFALVVALPAWISLLKSKAQRGQRQIHGDAALSSNDRAASRFDGGGNSGSGKETHL